MGVKGSRPAGWSEEEMEQYRCKILTDLAKDADTCVECDEVHEYRPLVVAPTDVRIMSTWASPLDGHAYQRRFPPEVGEWLRSKAYY